MSDINVLIVVDGIFNLSTTYPVASSGSEYGPDPWFTLSHLINTLRNSSSPTFTVDTASRGFNAAGTFDAGNITNSTPDPNATIKGPNQATPTAFHFDDPGLDLTVYDEIWMFSDEGYDGPNFAVGPGPGEPGNLTQSELTAITNFMQQGGGVFATGDHDGLGSAMGGLIPRVRYMRKWYSPSDTNAGIPPLTVRNWPGTGSTRQDTLRRSATDVGDTFFFDDQSDDIPQQLTVLAPSHPAIQGATGVLTVYPDHMHEGEVVAPTGSQLTQTSATDDTLGFAGANFTEFPTLAGHQEVPIILAQDTVGTPDGPNGSLIGHVTMVGEGMLCENNNFGADNTVCGVRTNNNVLAAYDGHTVNVGRIVTDSSFHHFLDLNLLGDPCSNVPLKQKGFTGSANGMAVLKELEAFYINMATWLAWYDRKIYFVFGKNNYGRDEVTDNLSYPDAFYLFLEGFTPNVVKPAVPSFPSGSFNHTNILGLSITGPTITYDVGGTGSNANVSQRIRFAYEIDFTAASLASPTAFPAPGGAPKPYTLGARISIHGQPLLNSPNAEFFLLGGDDPYFTNINASPGVEPQFYLSQDLRVFTGTPGPGGTVPVNGPGTPPTLHDSFGDAYTYIAQLITWLNQNYGYLNAAYTPPDTNVSDPLDTLLPKQNGALEGDSLVTPKTGSNSNYNFAIARVRLKGPPGTASNVKVFFRLFTTQTFDTDFINAASAVTSADPNVTYPSSPSAANPQSPLPGTDGSGNVNGCSLPFFATANFNDSPSDYDAGGANNQSISIPGSNEYAWAFFGCFLNVNDASNQFGTPPQPVQQWLAGAVHNCLVAQIVCADAPILNTNGVIESPENSDKLAQRNLQVTTSGNPGFPATHRVPQTIDVRPSLAPQSTDRTSILSYPDEMMIDWGKTPPGSVANIYWPGVSAASVLQLARRLYPAQALTAADANTIQCRVAGPLTFIPIPPGTGGSFAGLFTVDLPPTVRYNDAFDVVVRRITTRQVLKPGLTKNPRRAGAADSVNRDQFLWRYTTGSFLARISVQEENKILPVDENLLAILKWRLGLIGAGNRWHPVLLRYIVYLSARINGMGGNASQIPASPNGYQQPSPVHGVIAAQHCHTGKVIGIRYDRFGDFAGFTILSESGHEHWFRGREHNVEELIHRAWTDRTLISVFVEPHDPDWPASIVLRR